MIKYINHPCLPTEMYVFILVRKRGVNCATCACIYKVFTRHLNVECFESAFPAIFLSYAPTFFGLQHSVLSGIQVCSKERQIPFYNPK